MDSNLITLDKLMPGQKAVIKKIDPKSLLKKRLKEIGIREGKEIFMKRNAPLGDPMEISVMGYNVSLRKNEAASVYIELIEGKIE